MHTYTALYDTAAEAQAAQDQLKTLGIIDADGASTYDKNTAGFEDDTMWRGSKGAVPEDADRHIYKEALRRGGYLLTVHADDESADRVLQAIEATNPVDLDERERDLHASGFQPAAAAAGVGGALAGAAAKVKDAITPDHDREPAGFASRSDNDSEVIPIVEEQLRVGKRQVNRGSVRVRAYAVETPVNEQVTLHEERLDIERRAVNQPLSAATGDAFRERTIEATATAEEVVVAKDARVVEEVLIHKDAADRTETISDTVRRTEVDVERIEGDPSRPETRR